MLRCIGLALVLSGNLTGQNIFTVAGIPYSHRNDVDSQQALSAPLGNVYGLLIDMTTGRTLFNDESLVLRIEPDGSLLTVAGLGASTPLFQLLLGGNLASNLSFAILRGMAQDSKGALYLSDAGGGRVYRIAADGTVSTFAGGGVNPPGSQSDGGPATAAVVASPRGLVFDSKGNLDIAEVYCSCIRQVTPAGVISTLYTLPASATPGRLRNIEGLAIDAQDNLYFAEWFGNLVVKVAANGSVSTIAGTGTPGFSGDAGPATAAQLNAPSGVAVDSGGNVYIADTQNHRIRVVAPNGTISTIAGTGTCGFSGDSGNASAAQLCQPAQLLFDSSGSMLIADYGNRRLRRVTSGGTITTLAGSGVNDSAGFAAGSSGNGGPEIHATFNSVGGVAFDSSGNLYVSDSQANLIRKVTPNGIASTFAGTGQRGYTGDGGPALQAQLFNPGPISVGPDNAVYIITGDSRVRKITPDGTINLVAGTGTGTGLIRSQGDGGPAVNATLNEPGEVAFDRQGNIYIADSSNARVRKIDKNGIITTVAGPGQPGVDYYNAVAVDPQGNLYVAWTHAPPSAISATVNRVNPDGSLTPVAGSGVPCTNGPGQWTGDGLPALQARLCAVIGLAIDSSGLLNLSEGGYSLVLRLAADGSIQRVAGNTSAIYPGDGGLATEANLVGGQGFSPEIVAFDPTGNLYLAEAGLNIVREVSPSTYKVAALPASLSVSGSTAPSQTIGLSANFAEPFPYSVHVSTADGGLWLTTNRVTGLIGESIVASFNPAGLAPGTYHGTIAIVVSAPVGIATQEIDVPISFTLP